MPDLALVFIDSRVNNYAALIAALPMDVEWHLLNAEEDGLAQLLSTLDGRSGFASIQILSHGSPGTLYLGSSILDSSTLGDHQAQLAQLGTSLSENGDLLLYGCNVAEGAAGQQFIQTLAHYTGADVAASTDLTGALALGGDWVLEARTGTIESAAVVDDSNGVNWNSTLTALYGTYGDDTLVGGAEDDWLAGHGGNDFLDGGAGNDAAVFFSPMEHYQFSVDANGQWLISNYVETQTLRNIEQVSFSDGTISLSQSQQNLLLTKDNGWLGEPSTVGLADGGHVLTWSQSSENGSGSDIFAQRYDASGAALGEAFRVSMGINQGNHSSPSITALAEGGYAIAWLSQDDTYSTYSIHTQRYDIEGEALGPENQVYSIYSWQQATPSISGLNDGGYIVSWSSSWGNNWNIYTQRYDLTGTAMGERTQVNSTTAFDQSHATVTVLTDGGYVVTWMGQGAGDDMGIYAQRYAASGYPLGGETRINNNTVDTQELPVISALSNGTYVIAWQSFDPSGGADIYTRHYDANGNALSDEIRANTALGGDQRASAITALSDGGYVLSWETYDPVNSPEAALFTRRFDAAGIPKGEETLIATSTQDWLGDSTLTALVDGGYLLSWMSITHTSNGPENSLHSQRFDANGAAVGPFTAELRGDASANVIHWNGNTQAIIDGAGGNDSLTGGTGDDQLQGGDGQDTAHFTGSMRGYGFSLDGNGNLQVTDTDANDGDSGSDAVSDIEQLAFSDGSVSLPPAGGLISTNQAHQEQTITGLSDGGYVIAWSVYNSENTSMEVFTQRYGVHGQTMDAEHKISTQDNQSAPAITALADGGYLVTWQTHSPGDSYDIFAQRYDSSGNALGAETRINSSIIDSQSRPTVAALPDGGYAIAWQSNSPNDYRSHIVTQRYDAADRAIGAETTIDNNTSDSQHSPVLGALSDSTYVLAWVSNSNIFTQHYDLNGQALGGALPVNHTAGNHYQPMIVALNNGSYMITWQSYVANGDTSFLSQCYDASGTAIGDETQLATLSTQSPPAILVQGDGSYVLTWQADEGPHQGASLYTQRFNANGLALGEAQLMADERSGWNTQPSITEQDDGGYLLAWNTYREDGSSSAHLQRFDANGNPLTELSGDSSDNSLTWTGNSAVILNGNAGNDSLSGGSAHDYLIGGTGNDSLQGGTGNDQLNGGDGADTLNGNGGADTLNGGAGADRYYIDNAADQVLETDASSTGGTDTVYSYLAAYSLGANVENLRLMSNGVANGTGNSLNNLIYAGKGDNVLDGALGIDTLSYAYATSAVTARLATDAAQSTGGSGVDTLLNFENLTGSNYNDRLTGNSAANTLNGGAGADTLQGGDGSDTYHVDNSGDLVVETNSSIAIGGTDSVFSYLSSYSLGAHVENLRIMTSTAANGTGNGVNNLIYAGAGNNVLDGGAGTDTVSYAYASSAVSVNLGSASAQATGGSGSDTLISVENLTGSKYNDTLIGSSGKNKLTGGTGNDLLVGGEGTDSLYGGSGADRFDFNALSEMGLGALRDVIGDFKSSEGDKIDLSTLDANVATATNDAFSFIGSAAFSTTNATGQLRFTNGVLYGSTNADGAAEFEISLLGVTTLNSTDLIA